MGVLGVWSRERGAACVLVVEDDPSTRFGVGASLRKHGLRVLEADSYATAVQMLQERPDVVVTDLRLPDGDALAVLEQVKRSDVTVPVFIVTGYGTIDAAVRAVKQGAEDFLTKPVELDKLAAVVLRAAQRREENRSSGVRRSLKSLEFEASSDAMKRVAEQIDKLRDADCSVLLLGETGTGKSVLARRIHAVGARGKQPFVEVNCPGLAKDFVETELFGHERGAFTGAHASKVGLLDAANGGTAFLDEIGDIDVAVQPKLLKVLEERRFRRMGDVRERSVDVRLLAATHQDLMASIHEGRFRADLYYRISTVTLTVPALRERHEDIVPLARLMLRELGDDKIDVAMDAQKALTEHPWPGNLRELRNVLERALIRRQGMAIRACDLCFDRPSERQRVAEKPNAPKGPGIARTLGDVQREHIESALQAEGGKVEAAARRLGIPRSTLYQRIKEYGIQPSRPKVAAPRTDPPESR